MIRIATYSLLCLMVAATANAQESKDKAQQDKAHRDQTQKKADSGQQVALPEYLKQLDLDSQQKQHIKQTIKTHNQKLRQTWEKFHQQHAEAVELEAAWLAAVQDQLSDKDKQKFDQQRNQDQHSSHASRTDSQKQQQQSVDNAQKQDRNANRDSGQAEQTQQAASGTTGDRNSASRGDDDAYGIVLIRMVSPERYLQGTNQTSEQKQQCSAACREYKQQLISAWEGMHRTHMQLVQIEADRMEAIEAQLTDAQLKKLKKDRHTASSPKRSETAAAAPQGSQKQ